MTIPLSNSVVQTAFTTIIGDLSTVKSYCLQVQSGTNSGGAVSSTIVLNMASACIQLKSDLTLLSGNALLLAQLNTYAQSQWFSSTLNLTTELTSVATLNNALITALSADYPHDAQGHLLDRTFSLTTGLSTITFTAVSLPNILPAISNLLADLA